MISRKATMKRCISSSVPIDTRRWSSIGGKGRPTSTPFFRNSSITGTTGRRMCVMKKFVYDGIDV